MGKNTDDFVGMLGEALRSAYRGGVRLSAGGSDLEWERFHANPYEDEEEGRRDLLDAFEQDPVAARFPGEPEGESKISYFLDGVQSTEEIGRIGSVPIVTTTIAAGIAHREEKRLRKLEVEGIPTLVRAVILPRKVEDPGARAVFEAVQEAGIPLAISDTEGILSGSPDLLLDSTQHDPEIDPADYSALKARAYRRASRLRAALEATLLSRWEHMDKGDSWIAVDGQLSVPVSRAVGLIKNTRRFFFGGSEARMLLELEKGERTTAFVPPWRVQRRDEGRPEDERASWYVRLWPAEASTVGGDATSGLVRIETVIGEGYGPQLYDEISRWILAERAPLAKPDLRWASMIYPVHHVEKMLKPHLTGGRRARIRLQREIAALQT